MKAHGIFLKLTTHKTPDFAKIKHILLHTKRRRVGQTSVQHKKHSNVAVIIRIPRERNSLTCEYRKAFSSPHPLDLALQR
jgi:hypothetical protein